MSGFGTNGAEARFTGLDRQFAAPFVSDRLFASLAARELAGAHDSCVSYVTAGFFEATGSTIWTSVMRWRPAVCSWAVDDEVPSGSASRATIAAVAVCSEP